MKNIFISLFLLVTLTLSAQQSVVPISHYPATNQFSPSDEVLIAIPGVTNKQMAASNLFGASLAVSSYGGFVVTTNIGNQLVVTMTNGIVTNLTVLGTLTSTNLNAAILSATNNNWIATTGAINSATNSFMVTATNIAGSLTNGFITLAGATNVASALTNGLVAGTNIGNSFAVTMTNTGNLFTGIHTFPSNAAPVIIGSNVVFWNSNGVHGFWITLHGTNVAF